MNKLSAIKTYLEIKNPSWVWVKADNNDQYAKIRVIGEKYIRDRNHEAGIAAESKPMIGKVSLKSILKNCLSANCNGVGNNTHGAIEAGNTIVMDYHCCGRGSEMQYLKYDEVTWSKDFNALMTNQLMKKVGEYKTQSF